MQSMLRAGPQLVLKVMPESGEERIVGYATGLNYTVAMGLKSVFVVDSPFPGEIQNGAAPVMVRGTMTVFLPKGTTLESAGLVPYRTAGGGGGGDASVGKESNNAILIANAKHAHIRLYDRSSGEMVLGCNFCKIASYTVNVGARQMVTATINFEGMFCVPGRG
jgi:hypothetical protein